LMSGVNVRTAQARRGGPMNDWTGKVSEATAGKLCMNEVCNKRGERCSGHATRQVKAVPHIQSPSVIKA
jgi:hypothetical protein